MAWVIASEPIRQDYQASVPKWKSGGDVKSYMAHCQHEASAMEEGLYFKGAIDLAQLRFPKCRKKIKGLEWGAPLGKGQTLWWQLIQGVWGQTLPSRWGGDRPFGGS